MPRALVSAVLVASLLLLAGCGGDERGHASGPGTGAPSDGAAVSPTTPPTATAAPAPTSGRCFELDYDQAVSPVAVDEDVACSARHTAETFHVGAVDAMVSGHLLAVDSDRVQSAVATSCPARLPRFLGATADQLRLSMVQAIWFTPSVEQSDAGADWFRCDVVVVAGDERLVTRTGSLANALATPAGREEYAMCGTDQPGAADFDRVLCSAKHSWKAISVVPFDDGAYPGVEAAKAKGQTPCADAGREVADDPLDYRWAYEWPTAADWSRGQHYGRCWAPDAARSIQ